MQVRAGNGAIGNYAMIFLLSDSYNFVAKGILNYGDSRTTTLMADSDHFWFFDGEIDDTITLAIIPNDDGDLFLELYGSEAENISGFVDDGLAGEQEQLVGHLP